MKTIGSRAEVFHGTALKTSGGLTKKDLFKGKDGRIKSRKASALAKRNNQLEKAGWGVKKGEFGAVRLEEMGKKSPRRSPRKSPRRSASKSPRRSARRSATRSPRRSATRSPRRSARRSATRSPRRSFF